MNKGSFKEISTLGLLTSAMTLSCVSHAALMIAPTSQIAAIPSSQTPSDESLEKLMVVQQFDKSMADMRQNIRPMMIEMSKKNFADLTKNEHLTPTQNRQIQQAFQNFMQNTFAELDTPKYQLAYKTAFKETAKTIYTQQEVNAMIDFYGSSMGQQIQRKQSQFALSYMQKIMPTIQQMQQELIKTRLPSFVKEIERIKKSS